MAARRATRAGMVGEEEGLRRARRSMVAQMSSASGEWEVSEVVLLEMIALMYWVS